MHEINPINNIAFRHCNASGTSLDDRLYDSVPLKSFRTSVIKLNDLRLRRWQLSHALRLPLSSQIDRLQLEKVWIRIAVLIPIANVIAIADKSFRGRALALQPEPVVITFLELCQCGMRRKFVGQVP